MSENVRVDFDPVTGAAAGLRGEGERLGELADQLDRTGRGLVAADPRSWLAIGLGYGLTLLGNLVNNHGRDRLHAKDEELRTATARFADLDRDGQQALHDVTTVDRQDHRARP